MQVHKHWNQQIGNQMRVKCLQGTTRSKRWIAIKILVRSNTTQLAEKNKSTMQEIGILNDGHMPLKRMRPPPTSRCSIRSPSPSAAVPAQSPLAGSILAAAPPVVVHVPAASCCSPCLSSAVPTPWTVSPSSGSSALALLLSPPFRSVRSAPAPAPLPWVPASQRALARPARWLAEQTPDHTW